MAVHCHECGFVNPEGANYCQKCGAYLARTEGGSGDEPSTLTYKIAETGDFQPIDIEEMVEEEGAAPSSAVAGAPVRASRSTRTG